MKVQKMLSIWIHFDRWESVILIIDFSERKKLLRKKRFEGDRKDEYDLMVEFINKSGMIHQKRISMWFTDEKIRFYHLNEKSLETSQKVDLNLVNTKRQPELDLEKFFEHVRFDGV